MRILLASIAMILSLTFVACSQPEVDGGDGGDLDEQGVGEGDGDADAAGDADVAGDADDQEQGGSGDGESGEGSGSDSGTGEGGEDDGKVKLSGSVGALALGSFGDTPLGITAYSLGADGSPGATLGSAALGEGGSFELKVPPQSGQLQIAIMPLGVGLLDTNSRKMRLQIDAAQTDTPVTINEITELATRRMYKRMEADPSLSLEDAKLAGYTEASALVGVVDPSLPPTPYDQEVSESRRGYSYQLFLDGLAKRREALEVDADTFVDGFLSDAEDGLVDGKAQNETVRFDGERLYHTNNISREMRELMKEAVKDTAVDQSVNLNDIPAIDVNPASTVDQEITMERDLRDYEPTSSSPFEHWIEFKRPSSISNFYTHDQTCIGPIQLQRLDEKGRPLAEGPALPATVSAEFWEVYLEDDCSGTAVTTVNIDANESQSSDLYFKPVRHTYNSLSAVVPSNLVEKVDYAYLYLEPRYNGKLISNALYVDIYDKNTGPIDSWQGIGQGDSMLNRDQCYAGAVSLICGGRLCDDGGIFPANLAITIAVGNLGLAGTGTAEIYSDAGCTTTQGISITLPQGDEYVPFFFKTSANLSRGFNSDWTLLWITLNGLYGQSFLSGNIYVTKQ